MNQWVTVQIPVSPEAAALLQGDEERRQTIGRMVTRLLQPDAAEPDPLEQLLAEFPRDANAPDVSPEEIAAEIAAARRLDCL